MIVGSASSALESCHEAAIEMKTTRSRTHIVTIISTFSVQIGGLGGNAEGSSPQIKQKKAVLLQSHKPPASLVCVQVSFFPK